MSWRHPRPKFGGRSPFARQKTQLDAEGAKDVGPPNGVEKWEFVNLDPRIHRIYQNVIGHIINDLI